MNLEAVRWLEENWDPELDSEHRCYHDGKVPGKKLASHPVDSVTWYQAVAFCRWLAASSTWRRGARLPTEVEWEYACRAGTRTRYWGGDQEKDLGRVGWYSKNSDSRTHRAGRKPANPWGLYDMHGNVWEWTSSVWNDDYSKYEDSSSFDPKVMVKVDEADRRIPRVIRGGGDVDSAQNARSASRNEGRPGIEIGNHGFRVLLPRVPPSE